MHCLADVGVVCVCLQVCNFTNYFSDGRLLCYLIHHYNPSLLPLHLINIYATLSEVRYSGKRRLLTTSLFKGIVANFCYYFYREHCPITSPGRVEVSQQLIMHTLWTTRQPRSVRLAEAFHIFLSSPNTQHIMNDGYHVEYLMESNHFFDRLIN